MEIYIEYAIIDNLVMNALIIYLVSKLQGLKISKTRQILSNLLGTIVSVIMPIFYIPNLFAVLLKLVLSLLMVLIICSRITIKKYITTYFLFIFVTALFGGICYFVISFLGLKCEFGGILFSDFSIPMGLILIILLFSLWIICNLIKVVKKNLAKSENYIGIDIRNNGRSLHLLGFIDSGNMARSRNGDSLIFITPKTFCKMYPDIDMIKFLSGNITEIDIKDSYYENIFSVGNSHRTLVVPIEEIEINGKSNIYRNVSVAISENNFGGQFDILLSELFVTKGV